MPLASDIKLIISDVDGVWTDGKIIYVGDSREIKEFNVRDGLAVKLAQRAGVRVGVITSRKSKAVERRCRELGILEVVQGAEDKLEALRRIVHAVNVDLAKRVTLATIFRTLRPSPHAGCRRRRQTLQRRSSPRSHGS